LHGVVKGGTLAAILRQAGLTPAEFLKLLECAADRADYVK
jgi:hypothetical protein